MTEEKTPPCSPNKFVPMQVTPVDKKDLFQQKELFEKNFLTKLNENDGVKFFRDLERQILKPKYLPQTEHWKKIMNHVQNNWNEFLLNPLEAIGKITCSYVKNKNLVGGTELMYMVPYIHKNFCVNFAPYEVFWNFVGALVLSIFFALDVDDLRDGFVFRFVLGTTSGDKVMKEFYNWFSQYLVDKKNEFSHWYENARIGDFTAIYIRNICLKEEYAVFQICPWFTEKVETEKFYENCFQIVQMVKDADAMVTISNSGNLSFETFLLLCVRRSLKIEKIETSFDQDDVNLMMDVISATTPSDPFLRLECLRVWQVSLLICCESPRNNNIQMRPKCLENKNCFLKFLLFCTCSSIKDWINKKNNIKN
jgi:hypothetical protein